MAKRALILGAGQDASFLAEILLEKDYEVHLLHRRSSADNLWRVRHLLDRIELHKGDMADPAGVEDTIHRVYPSEIYNEADQDHVDWSLATPAYSADITYGAVVRTLEALRRFSRACPHVRFFQPLSATMFGAAPPPQNEDTAFAPQSPYAVSKVAAYYACQHYRREYGLHVSTAIMYSHDSVRRQGDYLLHRICRGAVRIAAGKEKSLALGDLDAVVDIGCAREYMEGVHRLMQLPQPGDYVLSSGRHWTIRGLVECAFRTAGVKNKFDSLSVSDDTFHRPGPPCQLVGDSAKAREAFGFRPLRGPGDLVEELVEKYRREEG